MNNFLQLKSQRIKEWPNQVFLLFVLIGILPAVEDFSLFAVFGFSITKFHVHEEFRLLYSIPLYLIPIGIVLIVRSRNYYDFLGFLPVFFAAYVHLVESSQSVSLEKYEALIGIIHFLCYKIAFLYFIVKGKLRSITFLCSLVFIWILLDLQHLILFLTYTLLIRFLYLALMQNINIFREAGFKRTTYLALKSFLFWSPLLIFIIPGAILNSKMNKASIDRIYTHSFIESYDPDRKYKRDQFEKNLECSLEAEIMGLEEGITKGTIEIDQLILRKADSLPMRITKSYANMFKPTLPEMTPFFAEDDCGFWGKLNIPCQMKNGAKRGVNSMYARERHKMLQKTIGESKRLSNEIKDASKLTTSGINGTIQENVQTFTDNLKFTIQSTFDTIVFINLLLDIAFGFLILKSFMYVFSRVSFSKDDENYVTLLESETNTTKGTLHKFGNEYTIDPEQTTENYYVTRSFEPSGRAPKFSIPQWRAAAVARILTRNYAMNKVLIAAKPEKVHFKAMGSHEFVEWEIKKGEEVIFHFKNFVGMSEGVKINALVSLRLTSLLFGRLIFTTAKGPGKLILLTKGEPITMNDTNANASIATSRILAWQKSTRFNVESELNLVDVFMSGIYLRKKEGDPILIDADAKGRSKNGIVRFIKNFILPV